MKQLDINKIYISKIGSTQPDVEFMIYTDKRCELLRRLFNDIITIRGSDPK